MQDQSCMTSVSHCDMYSIAPKTHSIKASSPFSITEPSQNHPFLFPPPYTPFRDGCTEQQKRNILEVFHDEEPGSESDPIVWQPATHPRACGLVCRSEGMSRWSHNHPIAGQRVRNKRGNSTHAVDLVGSLPFERHIIPPRVEIRRAFSVRDVPVDLYSYYRASIGKWLGQKCVRNESTSSRTIGLLLPLEAVSTLGMSECRHSRHLLGTLS
jgi:hypothetical protein